MIAARGQGLPENKSETQMNLQRCLWNAQHPHRFKLDKISILGLEDRHKVSPLSRKLFAIFSSWERKKKTVF